MKAIVGFLNKRINLSEKARKITGVVFSLLFAAALAVFGYITLGVNFVLSLVLFSAAGFPLIRFRLYRTVFNNTFIIHALVIIATVFIDRLILEIQYDSTAEIRIISTAACSVVFFGFFEILAGAVMEYSGGETHPEYFPKALVSCFPLYFITIIYIPSETYFNNFLNYYYIYSDFFPYLFLKTLAFVLISAIVMCGLDEKAFVVVTRLFCGFTLAVYAQYMLMNGSLPATLDDRMDWDSLVAESILNSVIWVVLIILPLTAGIVINRMPKMKKSTYAKNFHYYISLFVGGIHLLTLIVLIIVTPVDLFDYSIIGLSNEEQFVVSKTGNIITIIADMADQDYFIEAYKKDPEKFDCLKDFTSYTNACMLYDSTCFSIPQFLTGADDYPDEYDSTEWKKNIWERERCTEFYSRLHQNGYKVNVFSDFASDYSSLLGKADNTIAIDKSDIYIDKALLYDKIELLARYRYFPIPAKRYCEEVMLYYLCEGLYVPNHVITDNAQFMEALHLNTSASDEKYFTVEHFMGTHGYSGKTTEQETSDCLDIFSSYISQLKDLGVYDDAVILITADHGEHEKDSNFPIFYLKLPGEIHDEMQYNSSPVWFTDLLATYLKAAGLWQNGDEDIFGRAVQDLSETEERERFVVQRVIFGVGEGVPSSGESKKLYGYHFTGDKYALAEREHSAPPDFEVNVGFFDLV